MKLISGGDLLSAFRALSELEGLAESIRIAELAPAAFDEAVRASADSDARFDGRGPLSTLGRQDRERYEERARQSLRAGLGKLIEELELTKQPSE